MFAVRTLFLSSLLLAACPGGEDSGTKDDTSAAPLLWYTTCGDPVCSGYGGPFDGVALCSTEAEGAACTTADARCDPVSDCDALLLCTREDPKTQPGGCPISLKKYKDRIHYLSPGERDQAAQALQQVKLATWHYKSADPATPKRLGFLIDDQPAGSPAVLPDGGHVDVYGYTSLTVAAVQSQNAQILALQAQVASLAAEVAAMKAAQAEERSPGPWSSSR